MRREHAAVYVLQCTRNHNKCVLFLDLCISLLHLHDMLCTTSMFPKYHEKHLGDLQARNWNNLVPSGKGESPTRIDYTEEGDVPLNTTDRDLTSGASASATEDEGAAGARGAGVSRMDVDEDDYDDVSR